MKGFIGYFDLVFISFVVVVTEPKAKVWILTAVTFRLGSKLISLSCSLSGLGKIN
ncbi:MAG: hypothetical protein ACTS4X_00885 [Candidatus Hodgkinia cicadicola]